MNPSWRSGTHERYLCATSNHGIHKMFYYHFFQIAAGLRLSFYMCRSSIGFCNYYQNQENILFCREGNLISHLVLTAPSNGLLCPLKRGRHYLAFEVIKFTYIFEITATNFPLGINHDISTHSEFTVVLLFTASSTLMSVIQSRCTYSNEMNRI